MSLSLNPDILFLIFSKRLRRINKNEYIMTLSDEQT